MSSLKRFLALRETFPYAIKMIDGKWYLIDRGYEIISKEFDISGAKLIQISKIAEKLDGGYIEQKNDKISGIWFYNDGLRKAISKKGYLDFFSESLRTIKSILESK